MCVCVGGGGGGGCWWIDWVSVLCICPCVYIGFLVITFLHASVHAYHGSLEHMFMHAQMPEKFDGG